MRIEDVKAFEVLDSRGTPTICAEVFAGGAVGTASVPSGASVGKFEAVEKRDGDKTRYFGKGVLGAVNAVKGEIHSAIVGRDFSGIQELDDTLIGLDGTENKSRLGANALLAVSMAGARAFAAAGHRALYEYIGGSRDTYILPTPMMNILNGGAHASNNVEIQEFMVMPIGAGSFSEAMRIGAEVYAALKSELKKRGLSTAVGDEGGFAPDLSKDEQALEYILYAAKAAGVENKIALALDVAASEWYEAGDYHLPKTGKQFVRADLIEYYQGLVKAFPIVSIEDPMGEEDYGGFQDITSALPIQIVGDDLFVTNTKRIRKGIDERLANAVLIKLNQIGTVSEAIRAVELARDAGFSSIISHRSGETEDSFIADFSVGLSTGQIKTGAPARGERTAKYNRLLLIEQELGKKAVYGGARFIAKT